MNTTSFVMLALLLGVVIGAGVTLIIAVAFRARARFAAENSPEIPEGITAVFSGMDDAACAVDGSGTVVAASAPAQRYGITVGVPLENQDMRQLVRSARASASSETATFRIAPRGVSIAPRLVAARASVVSSRLVLLMVRDMTEQERLDQMRTDFVANTSHELKTPVGAVSLLAEAIESAADDPAQVRVFAARIQAEASRLGHLTGRIMSLSRLQSADGVGEFAPLAVDEIVAASVEAHVVQADSAGVELARGGDRGSWVNGDAQVLIEAIGNLIANAIVYSSRGGRVGVGVRADGEVVEIAVTDQGIGIAPEDRERIFERFYRADEARSRRTGGTGLGLSIVKHATQRHGGEVRVWSRPGRGSTFTIRLPQAEQPRPETSGRKKKTPKKRTAARAARMNDTEHA